MFAGLFCSPLALDRLLQSFIAFSALAALSSRTRLMLRRYPVLTLFAVVSLAACSTDLVAPTKTVRGPSFALSTGAESGTYLVLMKGNGIPAGFATRVANLGGMVTYLHTGTGIATVTGLSDNAATQLAASSGVADVQRDEAF